MSAQRRPDEPERNGGGPELTVLEHLQELRKRMFISALAIAIGVVIGLLISKQTISLLEEPGKHVYPGFRLQYIEQFEFVSAYFKVAILIGLILAMPVLLYELLAFIVPALTGSERKWLFPILFGALALFLGGAAFSYFVVVPNVFDFLLNFGKSQADPHIRISNYIDTITHLVFWVGVMFELPIIMMAPAKFRVITARRYLRWWRYAIVLGFVAAAAVIPNINPLMQIMVAVPIIGLYFLGVLLSWLVQPKLQT